MTEVQNGGTLTEELRTLVSDAEALVEGQPDQAG